MYLIKLHREKLYYTYETGMMKEEKKKSKLLSFFPFHASKMTHSIYTKGFFSHSHEITKSIHMVCEGRWEEEARINGTWQRCWRIFNIKISRHPHDRKWKLKQFFYWQFEVWEINLKEASVRLLHWKLIGKSFLDAFEVSIWVTWRKNYGKMGEIKLFEIGWLKRNI